jgi:GNAT superfamily N-acetyltransferase
MIYTKNPLLIDKIRIQALQEQLYVPGFVAEGVFKKNQAQEDVKIQAISFEKNVGWCLHLKWLKRSWRREVGYTVSVFVKPELRRQGIATQLLKEVHKYDPTVVNYGYGTPEGDMFFSKYFKEYK